MKTYFYPTSLLLAACLAVGPALQASTRLPTSTPARTFADSASDLLSGGSFVLVGTFSSGTDFAAHVGDYTYLTGQFTIISSAYIPGGGISDLQNAFPPGLIAGLGTSPIYYWVFNSDSANSTSPWQIVAPPDMHQVGSSTDPIYPTVPVNTSVPPPTNLAAEVPPVQVSVDDTWPWAATPLLLVAMLGFASRHARKRLVGLFAFAR